MEATCLVCMGSCPGIRCSEYACKSTVCPDCMERFLQMCLRDKSIPRCISPNCIGLYLRSSCDGHTALYDDALLAGLQNDSSVEEEKRHRATRKALLANIIEERRRFLVTHFPASIKRAVEILYSRELMQIERLRRNAVDNTARQVDSRRCFHTFCNGYVSLVEADGWRCSVCRAVFCSLCEEDRTEDHACNPEEIASVQWKQALTQCPRCKQYIEKGEGCDFVTCSVCRQNFQYSTGEESKAGNHGQSKPTALVVRDGITALCDLILRGREVNALSEREVRLLQRVRELGDELHDVRPAEWRPTQVISGSARSVAIKVERLEKQRQNHRRLTRALRELEGEIKHG